MTHLIHQLLEKSAKLSPNKEAIIYKGNCISYRELELISNQVAHVLLKSGVKKGDRVGIYLDKSIEAVVVIFGILKAGAVYVPLDPSVPAKRTAFIIDNCSIKVVFCTTKIIVGLFPYLSESSSVQCLIFTDEGTEEKIRLKIKKVTWQMVRQAPSSSSPAIDLIESDLAYILYTSGSTGTPKGVMMSHCAALSFINWSYACFQVQPADRISNHAPLHFDLSIFDIFTTIKAGATVILVPPNLSAFAINLADFIEKERITIWYSVPLVLTQLVLRGHLQRHQFHHLRCVLFAGEVFPIKYLRQLMSQISDAKYYNLYGPTETNVCTYYQLEEIPPEAVDVIPIGKACANTEVLVLNDRGEIADFDEEGELCVRGTSLMTGYWGMPEQTQAVIVPYPKQPSLNMYRTGDRVKQALDGNYFYLGRRDSLIKSRGYRIELGEIETVIGHHPKVEEVAVIPIAHEHTGNEIKAVVVRQAGSQLSERDLLPYCAKHLPKYMIPSIEFQNALPKTSTGKVDRTLLRQQYINSNYKAHTNKR